MNVSLPIPISQEKLILFCQKNDVQKLSLFGSILTNRFRPDSDVDVLVEFKPGKRCGFFGLSQMEIELTDIFSRRVDLRTPKELSRYFRDEVLSHAQVAYAQT